ncbi:MAG: DUF1631 family protein [Pseudomonadaceae bacterium]|nr:DUF1631 family protein [Pseudomonadaceae bacterium]
MLNSFPAGLADALSMVVRQRLPGALDELLKALQLALAEQHLRAISNREAQACADFQRFCARQGDWLQASVCASICRHLPQCSAALAEQVRVHDEWTLVDDTEVEDMLLARRMVRQLRESLGDLEWRACACLNRIGGEHVADADHPLSLEYLLRQLQAGLRLSGQPEAIRQLFLEQAVQVLGDALRDYYAALVAQFDRQRITPLPEPQAPSQGRRTLQGGRKPSSQAAWQAMHGLQGGESPAQAEAPGGQAPAIAAALSPLYREVPPRQGWSAPELLAQLERQGCRLSTRQREDTQLVSEMFQALGEEARIAPALKPTLQRLLLPVLQSTLEDSAAIADGNHPVRTTLDRLLRLCDHSEPPNKALESRVQEVVEQMLAAPEAFTSHDAELDELLQQQQRAYRHAAERVMQQHRGRDILEKARSDVATAISGLTGEQMPKLLQDWLDAGWREMLVNELIRRGDEDYSWRVDLALTSLLAKRLQEGTEELAAMDPVARTFDIDHLLQLLKRRMDEFGAGHYQHGPVLGQLRRQLLGEEQVEFIARPPEPPPRPVVSAEHQRWLERVQALKQGDWLHDAQGQPLQLVWSNPERDHYVLVDGRGHEAGDYGAAELSERLADGSLMIGEAASGGDNLIQRTLQDMVGRLYREIAHARSHDELTGLLNRRSFDGAVAQALSSGGQAAFLMLHLDQFSLINSHAGPVAGDACLRQVANCLGESLPAQGSLARLGGVEFAAVLPGCTGTAAVDWGERVRVAVESAGFAWQGHRHGLSLSIGVVEAARHHDVANLLCDLHAACSVAKEQGRNRVHRFDSAVDEARTGLLTIAARVDDIVEREDLSLRVQQIAPTDSQAEELPHYELLLVMQNELQLQDFIAAAERYSRMAKVDRWVLRRIFAELERCPQVWQHSSGLSINLSGSSLNDDRLLGFIESLFERYAVDPRHICFELTETTAVANLAKTADLVRQLQRAGCTFSIDDFGVGFSSYDYLKRLPVDYVKIDGSFVKEIEHSSGDLAMVRSINEIAHALGRRTIAEYVETPAIRSRLAELGVDYVQGFGVQRPRALGDWLASAEVALSLP